MKIAIVDDDERERKKICVLLQEWGKKRSLALECSEFADGEDFLRSGVGYQVVFLDIYMKRQNGIDAARVLRKYDKTCRIIFMTISEDHRADAFEVHAYDYLEKPITVAKIERVMADLIDSPAEDQSYIMLSSGRSQVPILFSELQYVISDANYCVLQTERELRVRIVFSELEKLVSCERRFLKINRGILVNLDFVASMENRICTMRSGKQFPINARRADELYQELIYYRFDYRNRQLSQKRRGGIRQEQDQTVKSGKRQEQDQTVKTGTERMQSNTKSKTCYKENPRGTVYE